MGRIALCNINYVDIENGTFSTKQTIEILDNRIVDIYDTHLHYPVDCDYVYDYTDCWALPGLVDMHVHITMSPTFDDSDYYLSPKEIVELTHANLNELRKIGVTTCRDIGSFMQSAEWVKFVLHNEASLPYVMTCGNILTYPQGHMCDFGRQVSSLSDINVFVKENFDSGAEFIKVTSDPKDTEAHNRFPNPAFPVNYLKQIVESAAKFGLSVACHTYPSIAGVYRALQAGIRTIEHAVPFNDSMGKLFFPNTFYVPTLATAIDICGLDSLKSANQTFDIELLKALEKIMPIEYRYDGPVPESISEWFNILITILPKAIASNQLICTGSDAGCKGTNFSTLLREIILMCLLGATNQQALQYAITNPCNALRLRNIGKISVGYIANLIVLKDNPLTNILTLLDNVAVICNGNHISSS